MNRYGLFQSGGLNYAIPLLQIRKIVQGGTTYSLPRLPQSVPAVLVDAGELIPLLSLNLLREADGKLEHVQSGYLVLVESEYGAVALPAELNGKIVAEKKGTRTVGSESREAWVSGEFTFQNKQYKILDINFLAIEMTQNFWRDPSDSCGVRRHP